MPLTLLLVRCRGSRPSRADLLCLAFVEEENNFSKLAARDFLTAHQVFAVGSDTMVWSGQLGYRLQRHPDRDLSRPNRAEQGRTGPNRAEQSRPSAAEWPDRTRPDPTGPHYDRTPITSPAPKKRTELGGAEQSAVGPSPDGSYSCTSTIRHATPRYRLLAQPCRSTLRHSRAREAAN